MATRSHPTRFCSRVAITITGSSLWSFLMTRDPRPMKWFGPTKRLVPKDSTLVWRWQRNVEESEKFQGVPGVVFVLPDSYIDPQNKEYGGDKYINGTIKPRPPPIQHHTGGRFRDRNRNFDRRRDVNFGAPHSQQGGPMQNQQTWP